MSGIDRGKMTTTTTMINRVNTMTPRQNDLVVKNMQLLNFISFLRLLQNKCKIKETILKVK